MPGLETLDPTPKVTSQVQIFAWEQSALRAGHPEQGDRIDGAQVHDGRSEP